VVVDIADWSSAFRRFGVAPGASAFFTNAEHWAFESFQKSSSERQQTKRFEG
jgi:hypothetical protein